MLLSTDPTSELVAQTKHNFERYSGRLLHLFSFVPDDRLDWSPSPTAKSSLRIVAHCALTCRFFANIINGALPEPMPTADELLSRLSDSELTITSREGAIALMQEATAEFSSAIGTVNSHNINATANSPFGPIPLQFWIQQGTAQIAGHTGQPGISANDLGRPGQSHGLTGNNPRGSMTTPRRPVA